MTALGSPVSASFGPFVAGVRIRLGVYAVLMAVSVLSLLVAARIRTHVTGVSTAHPITVPYGIHRSKQEMIYPWQGDAHLLAVLAGHRGFLSSLGWKSVLQISSGIWPRHDNCSGPKSHAVIQVNRLTTSISRYPDRVTTPAARTSQPEGSFPVLL